MELLVHPNKVLFPKFQNKIYPFFNFMHRSYLWSFLTSALIHTCQESRENIIFGQPNSHLSRSRQAGWSALHPNQVGGSCSTLQGKWAIIPLPCSKPQGLMGPLGSAPAGVHKTEEPTPDWGRTTWGWRVGSPPLLQAALPMGPPSLCPPSISPKPAH